MRIPISKPLFGEEERRAVQEPLETGWVVQGPRVAEFEQRFSEFTKIAHAVATTSCTTALELALKAFDIGPGDEVVVPAFTWIATASSVELRGARPVLVDIELETFNIDVTKIPGVLSGKTRALMPVSLFGISAPMRPILEIARSRALRVIEDCACAFGATYEGQHAGALADAAAFSFHPRKAISTGEGGMLVTNDAHLADKVRSLRDHGASKSDLARHLGPKSYLLPDFDLIGFNARMTDLQGALGVAQMKRAEHILERRTHYARRYDEAIAKLGWLRPPVVPSERGHGYQAYVTLFRPETPKLSNVKQLHARRNAVMDRLEAAGVATRPGTHALHTLGAYRSKYGFSLEDFPNAHIAEQLTLTLPLYPQMTDEEHDYVLKQLSTIEP
jgi:perosamine synthetase